MSWLISAKSLCASFLIPHQGCIVWFPPIWKSFITGIHWKCGKSVSEALSLGGDSLPALRESLSGSARAKMEMETNRGRLYFPQSLWGLQSQSCSNIERKSSVKLGFWFPAWLLCATEGDVRGESSWKSPWKKLASLLEQPELINKWCCVSSSQSQTQEVPWFVLENGAPHSTVFILPPPSLMTFLVPLNVILLKIDGF